MTDSTDDVDWYIPPDCYLDNYDDILCKLELIANADLSNFENQQHMINYMKKIARSLINEMDNNE